MGILIGLAIYNSHILEFRFPLVTYKKLLGFTPTLADLEGVSPLVHRSFLQLLAYEGDVKEHFDLTFQVCELLGPPGMFGSAGRLLLGVPRSSAIICRARAKPNRPIR